GFSRREIGNSTMRISGLILCLLVIACAPVCARSSSIDNLPLGVASPTPSPKAQSGTSNPGDGAAKRSSALPPEKANPAKMAKFEKPPAIDGKLDEEVWKSATVLKDFIQVQPGDNIAPSKPTEVLLGYDSKFIYIGFHCYDEPDKVRSAISKRDNVWNDDYVGILFDTFNERR